MSENENEYDSELEQEAQFSRLENITNYLKQMSLHISATIKQPFVRMYANNVIENFDKCIDQYNNQFHRLRNKKLIYFKIQAASIAREDKYFAQSVYAKEKVPGQQGYFANIMFAKAEEGNFYRMHVEIWKFDNQIVTTNKILSRFEKNCMNELHDALDQMGFVSHSEGSAVVLVTKRPIHRVVIKSMENTNIMECVKAFVENFIKEMSQRLLKEEVCHYCNKHLMFESKFHLMMPPTFPLVFINEKSRSDQENKPKMFHQVCSFKFLRGQGTPAQFKQTQRIRPTTG